MENKMLVRFICGINGDRVEVKVVNPENMALLDKELIYGVNVSNSRKNAVKYNWPAPKPFIGDVLMDIVETYFINDIIYSGYFAFCNEEMTKDEVEQIVNSIIKEM